MNAPAPPASPALPSPYVLYIKHMVCPRGIRAVRQELERLGLRVLAVRLGAATVLPPPAGLDRARLRQALAAAGFALLENPARDLAGCLPSKIAELLRRQPPLRHRAFAAALARELALSPARLNSLFASWQRGSLAAYIGQHRLLLAQELLAKSDLAVGRIARQLGYTSLAHFSGQFRRFAQCSPSAYRQQQRRVSKP